MKTIGFASTAVILLAGAIVLCSKSAGFFSGLYFVPLSLGPLFVSLIFALALRSKRKSQLALLVGSLLYGGWFAIAYLDFFYWHLDPQSAIGLLFVGIYALPVMAIVWMVAAVLGRTLPEDIEKPATKSAKRRKAAEPGATDNPDDAQCLREGH